MGPLRRSAVQALQALLQLAQEPQQWLSVSTVATAQELPAPMLEQLLLDLRRAGLVRSMGFGSISLRGAARGDPRVGRL